MDAIPLGEEPTPAVPDVASADRPRVHSLVTDLVADLEQHDLALPARHLDAHRAVDLLAEERARAWWIVHAPEIA